VRLPLILVKRTGTHPSGQGCGRIDACFLGVARAKKIVHSPIFRGALGKSNQAALSVIFSSLNS
jgi:hypothetical protein